MRFLLVLASLLFTSCFCHIPVPDTVMREIKQDEPGIIRIITPDQHSCSAFYIGDYNGATGHFLTAAHCIDNATILYPADYEGVGFVTIKVDHDRDLALLRTVPIDQKNIGRTKRFLEERKQLNICAFPSAKGAPVLVLGYPGYTGLEYSFEESRVLFYKDIRGVEYLITAESLTFGYSGGPVLDTLWGCVAGVNSMVIARDSYNKSLGIHVSAQEIRNFLDELVIRKRLVSWMQLVPSAHKNDNDCTR